MTRIFTYGSTVLGFACLATGWARAGYWYAGLLFLILIPLSIYLLLRGFSPAPGSMLAVAALSAAGGLWAGIGLPLALAAVLCMLAAWDLAGFSRRLAFASAEDDAGRIERQHFLHLSLALLAGAGLVLLAQSIRQAFGFEWTLLLAILAFYGIGALMSGLSRVEG